MNAPVIIRSGQPERGGETGIQPHLPKPGGCTRHAAAAAASHSHRERFGAFFAHIVFPVMRTVGALNVMAGDPRLSFEDHDGKSVRLNFSRPLRRPGSLLLGNARFQLRQKSLRCVADALHALSFPNAPELHEQLGRRRLECPTRVLKDLTK